MTELEVELLKTLSHFEAMTLDKIFIDLSQEFVMNHPELSMQDVLDSLLQLKKLKLVTCRKRDGHKEWLKVFPNRKSFWPRFLKNWFR